MIQTSEVLFDSYSKIKQFEHSWMFNMSQVKLILKNNWIIPLGWLNVTTPTAR